MIREAGGSIGYRCSYLTLYVEKGKSRQQTHCMTHPQTCIVRRNWPRVPYTRLERELSYFLALKEKWMLYSDGYSKKSMPRHYLFLKNLLACKTRGILSSDIKDTVLTPFFSVSFKNFLYKMSQRIFFSILVFCCIAVAVTATKYGGVRHSSK